MEKKKLKLIIIIVSVIVLLLAGFLAYKLIKPSSKELSNNQLLYEVTKEGSNNKMYLFGSIHLAKTEDLDFPSYIMNAYNNSQYLACEYNSVEANNNAQKVQEIAMNMIYQDGTTIKDHIDEDTYNKLVKYLTEKESYSPLYDYYKPVFFYSFMSSLVGNDANLSAAAGVDDYFIKKAIYDKKEILEVESMEYQMNLLLSFSDDIYVLSIKDLLDNPKDSVDGMIELYNSWKTGDVNKLLEFNDEDIQIKDEYTEKQKQEIADFNKKIVDDRNLTMTEKAKEYFDSNKDVFFMVGALHIVGDNGIAKNLERAGYKVTRIS